MLSTSFWNDGYTANLDPTEKLLFIYLLTNERSTLAGVYQLPIKIMAVETGIDTEMVRKILARFEDEEKISMKDGWVAIRNFSKHHPAGSPTVQKGIEDALREAPEWARRYVKGIDTLSPSASASAFKAAETPVLEVKDIPIGKEERPKKESRAKYPNAPKAIKWFKKTDPAWLVNTTELKCLEIIYDWGEEVARKRIDYAERHLLDDGFILPFVSPYMIANNVQQLKAYAKRNS